MRKNRICICILIFAAAFFAGIILCRRAEYECSFEPYAVSNTQTAEQSVPDSLSADGIVNINTAGKDELMTLNGIGEAMAERIISYRTEKGAFEVIEDMLKVPGIGEKKFERIREYITVK